MLIQSLGIFVWIQGMEIISKEGRRAEGGLLESHVGLSQEEGSLQFARGVFSHLLACAGPLWSNRPFCPFLVAGSEGSYSLAQTF